MAHLTRYALDTSVASEIFQQNQKAILAWLDDTPNELLFLPMPTVGELYRYTANEMLSQAVVTARTRELNLVLSRFAMLEADLRVFAEWARITANLPGAASDRARLHVDALIAATGLVYDMTVATSNLRDFNNFTRFGVRLYDPSTYQRPDLA